MGTVVWQQTCRAAHHFWVIPNRCHRNVGLRIIRTNLAFRITVATRPCVVHFTVPVVTEWMLEEGIDRCVGSALWRVKPKTALLK